MLFQCCIYVCYVPIKTSYLLTYMHTCLLTSFTVAADKMSDERVSWSRLTICDVACLRVLMLHRQLLRGWLIGNFSSSYDNTTNCPSFTTGMLRLLTVLMNVSIDLQTMQLIVPVQCTITYLCHHSPPNRRLSGE